jgi:Phosphotransferase enzyme family
VSQEPADPQPPSAPGTNLKGQVAGAAWTYLLDSMQSNRTVSIGDPGVPSRETLNRLAAGRLDCRTPGEAGRITGTYDLVVLANGLKRPHAPRDVEQAGRLVGPDGRLYLERPPSARTNGSPVAAGLALDREWSITTHDGEVEAAMPMGDATVHRWARDAGMMRARPAATGGTLRRLLPRSPRTGVAVVSRRATDRPSTEGVPAYVRAIAAEGGLDLSGYRTCMSARGRYASRKVLLYLFASAADRPSIIVKLTREPHHNERLHNEEQALREIQDRSLVADGSVPRVLFSGTHGGLRLVGEHIIEGKSLRRGSTPQDAEAAFHWLTALGVGSAEGGHRGSEEMRARVVAVHQGLRPFALSGDDVKQLTELLDGVAAEIPSVFEHGDAGAWNILRRPDGGVAFLDWEAARPSGVPLLDLFYFGRSYILSSARVPRLVRRPDRLVNALVGDRGFRAAVRTYVDRLGIPPSVVGPLFALCWAHRAGREATRLSPEQLEGSHYLGLLRRSLDPAILRAWNPL